MKVHCSYHGLGMKGVVIEEQTYKGMEAHVNEIVITLPDGENLFEALSHREQAQVIGKVAEIAEGVIRDRNRDRAEED